MGFRIPDLVGALEAGLRTKGTKDTWGEEHIHMSDLAVILSGGDEKCARQIRHRLNQDERADDSVGQMMMFDNGHSIHERVTDLIKEPLLDQGWEIIGVEVPVTEHLPEWMRGTLDLKLRGPGGEIVIVDYKTKKGNAFRWMNSAGEGNKIQLQGYMMVEDADYGMLLYIDREGQNTPVPFIVERNDARVIDGINTLEAIYKTPSLPARILPKLTFSRNKGPDGVKLELPWQCDYCPYLDKSCPGALKPELRGKIVGYFDKESGLDMKEEYEFLRKAVTVLIDAK